MNLNELVKTNKKKLELVEVLDLARAKLLVEVTKVKNQEEV